MIGVVGGFGASMQAPGYAHHNGMEFVRLGEYTGDGVSERVRKLGALWESGGFKVLLFDDVHQLVWEKLSATARSRASAVMGMTVGEILGDEAAWSVASACATEAWEVARAPGVKVDFDDPVAYVRAFGLKIPDARPSLLLDHLAGAALGDRGHQRRHPRRRRRGGPDARRSTPRSPHWSRSRSAPSERHGLLGAALGRSTAGPARRRQLTGRSTLPRRSPNVPYAEGRTFLDADSHIMELPDFLKAYADPSPARRRSPRSATRPPSSPTRRWR